MTIRERILGMIRPELIAAYRMRDQAERMRDIALRKASEAEKALEHEKVYSEFWCNECSASDERFIKLAAAVEASGNEDLMKTVKSLIYKSEESRAVYKAAGKDPVIVTVTGRKENST